MEIVEHLHLSNIFFLPVTKPGENKAATLWHFQTYFTSNKYSKPIAQLFLYDFCSSFCFATIYSVHI